jgi:hypothetical protein
MRRAAVPIGLLLLLPACDRAVEPPALCAAAWSAQVAADLVDLIERAGAADRVVWKDYDVGDAAYVLNAGASAAEAGFCLGIWQDGHAVSFTLADEEPALLTPLYGYYFGTGWYGGVQADMIERAEQPPAVRLWLESTGVQSAIILPVSAPDFPMELPALVKAQLAIHEAFHVDVQGPRWWASTGDWPAWERQPDRRGLQACYTAGDNVEAALAAEREHLAVLIEALLDNDTTLACRSGRAFLEQRNARYAMLSAVQVMQADSTPGTCAIAEAIMELEEGTADWASWTVLYDIGLASRESLLRRYRALQQDAFYLTGVGQQHAVQLMHRDGVREVIERISTSTGIGTGHPARF